MLVALVAGAALAARGQVTDDAVARVDGDVITADTLERALGPLRYRSANQRYEFRRQKLEELIDEKLLEHEAARRGMSVERLKEIEIKAGVRVTGPEIDAFYRERKASIPAPEAVAKETLKRYLEQQRELEISQRLLARLRSQARVTIHLEPPPPPSVESLVLPGAAYKGPATAPVTIVEFSDFQCPFCARSQAVLKQVLEKYPNDVKLVFRHFPLESHPQARLAAEAAECAARQGKFWEYHDQLFASAGELPRSRLQGLAETIGLDPQGFSSCLDGGTTGVRVAADLMAGRQLGVTGTPTFFVNGRMLEGAQPFAAFQNVIDLYRVLSRPRASAPR